MRRFLSMDLIPTPDQVVAAAGNVAHTLLYGGLADLRPMPRTLIDDGVLREVYHYPTQHYDHHRRQLTLDLAANS